MNSDDSQPTAQRDDGAGPPPATPLQRVIAGIALLALLASAAISSWWIFSGQVDFTANRPTQPAAADAHSANTAAPVP